MEKIMKFTKKRLRFKKKILFLLLVIIVIGGIFATWRGLPFFQLQTKETPGLLIDEAIKVDPETISVEIYKTKRKLVLYEDNKVIGIFKIALGSTPIGDKEKEGDGKTPEGEYTICYFNDKTPYLYFYGLTYPNKKDAQRGLKQKMISQEEYERILYTNKMNMIPPWHTSLGGEVGIHGGGSLYDWTRGCIALSDADILTLKKYLTIGTPVHIYP